MEDNTDLPSPTPIRSRRRRSSAPDVTQKGFFLWDTATATADEGGAAEYSTWGTPFIAGAHFKKLGGSQSDSAAKTEDVKFDFGSFRHLRRRSSEPRNAGAIQSQLWSKVFRDALLDQEEHPSIEPQYHQDIPLKSGPTSPNRTRRTSSNPDLDPDKLMELFDDPSADQPLPPRSRGGRRHSSRSSRSKSLEFSSGHGSFSLTIEKIVSSVLDEDDSDKKEYSKPTPTGIRQKRLSTQFEGYNQLFEFDLLEADDLPVEILRDLESEGCPFCGLTRLQKKKPGANKALYVVMFCKRFGCRHVAHNSCITEQSVRQLIPLHNTSWFLERIMPAKALDKNLKAVQSGTKSSLQLDIQVSHLVGALNFGKYSTSKEIEILTVAHIHGTAIETIHLNAEHLGAAGIVLPVARGRLQICLTDYEEIRKDLIFDGNYDLTVAMSPNAASSWALLYSKANLKQFLSVYVTRQTSRDGSMSLVISGIEIELGEPKVAIPKLSPLVQPLKEDETSDLEEKRDFTDTQTSMQSVRFSNDIPMAKDGTTQGDMCREIQELLFSYGSYGIKAENPTVESLIPFLPGQVANISRTQIGSRFLQEQIRDRGQDFIALIIPEVHQEISNLMKDLFGNYLCQMLIRECTPEQRVKLLVRLSPDMGDVACDRQGTRVMQKVIQYAASPNERDVILNALSVHLLRMMFDPHGSYVVNALIDEVPFPKLQTVLNVLCSNCKDLAVNQHGLCVMKKFLSRSVTEKDSTLITMILEHVQDVVNNQYGNYLVQHILTLGDEDAKMRLHRKLQNTYCALSKQKFSSNVVEKCLTSLPLGQREEIINEFMNSDQLALLLEDSYGNYVMQNALSLATGSQAMDFIAAIKPELKNLRKKIQKKWEGLLQTAEQRVKGSAPGPAPTRNSAESPAAEPQPKRGRYAESVGSSKVTKKQDPAKLGASIPRPTSRLTDDGTSSSRGSTPSASRNYKKKGQ